MGDKYRILAVDDDSDVLSFIEIALSSKYEVISSTDGEEAIIKFKECDPDLVLLDVMMPGLSGYEVCQQMRMIQGKGHIPIIMLSALNSIEDHKSGYHEGATFYLTKPIPEERLIKNIDVQLSTFGKPQPKKLTIEQIKSRKYWEKAPPPVSNPKTMNSTKPVINEAKKSHQNPRILIVDDDPDILNTLKLLFDSQYELLTASEGLEALRKATAYEPDLIILDIMLPKVNGLQICTAIRKIERFVDLPIIFLTAKDDSKTKIMGEQLGAYYMMKPVEIHKLSDKVHELINLYPGRKIPKRFSYSDILMTESQYAENVEDRKSKGKNWMN